MTSHPQKKTQKSRTYLEILLHVPNGHIQLVHGPVGGAERGQNRPPQLETAGANLQRRLEDDGGGGVVPCRQQLLPHHRGDHKGRQGAHHLQLPVDGLQAGPQRTLHRRLHEGRQQLHGLGVGGQARGEGRQGVRVVSLTLEKGKGEKKKFMLVE